ncbi:MAG: hypothetical protein AAB241_03250 [Pseudomonadota bacterium]
MKNDDLKTSIDALKAIREGKHQELSTSIIDELDAVIQDLESHMGITKGEVEVPFTLISRALKVMGEAILVATNLAELIRTFFDSQ